MTDRKRRSFWNPGRYAAWGIFLAILTGAAACGEKNVYVPPPPPKVTVSQPAHRDFTDYLEFTGNAQAINTVQLRARVEGYLEKVLFQDGDQVKKGQLLFLIQQNTYQAKLQQAEAEILAQKARLEHAKTEFTRFSRLVQKHAAAETDRDRWQFERDAAQAAVLAAEAKRDLARLDLSYTSVVAPFNGRIGRRLKDPGNLVGAGEETLLAEINQIDPIYVYFTINERDLLRVMAERRETPEKANRYKTPAYLGLANEEGYPHQGRLDFAGISLNAATGTLLLRGIFPNPGGKILPGLFARVRVPLAHAKPALMVPQVAIGYDQLGSYVLVVNDQNVVGRVNVKVGPVVDERRVIEEGLTGKEWVIVNGLLRAIPGRQVTPAREEPPGAAAPKKASSPKAANQKKSAP
jgi:RND family efflux transporter MFP subunit